MLQKVIERRIAYYSDFDLSISEWKSDNDRVNIFGQNLRKKLGTLRYNNLCKLADKWISELTSIMFSCVEAKSPFDAAVEYLLLTANTSKVC